MTAFGSKRASPGLSPANSHTKPPGRSTAALILMCMVSRIHPVGEKANLHTHKEGFLTHSRPDITMKTWLLRVMLTFA